MRQDQEHSVSLLQFASLGKAGKLLLDNKEIFIQDARIPSDIFLKILLCDKATLAKRGFLKFFYFFLCRVYLVHFNIYR